MQSTPRITYEVENALSSLSGVTLSEIKTAQELGEKVGYTSDQFFQFAKQADLSGDTLKQYQEYLKNTGSTASKLGSTLKSVAANMGIMIAVTLAVKAAVAIFDELNVTFEEQQEVVDALSTKITTLKDEYTSLSEKKDRTSQEDDQLKYLERQLEVQEELYKVEYNRLALKDLEGKGDILSNGNLKDLNPQSSGHGNEMYSSETNTAGLKYNINTELKKLDEARKKITEASNANTVKYWDNLQDKSVEKLKAQREQLLEEWKASSDSYNLIKKYMDTGAFDDDPTNKAKYQNLLKAYETDMNQLQAMTDDIEVSLGIKIDPSMDDAKDKIDDIKKEAEKPITIQVAISNIEALSTGLDKINAIREDIKDKGDFDFGSLVDEDFVAQFGGLGETYQNFIDTVANSPTDLKACQSAFDDLTTSYLYQNDALKNITKETYNATVTMLKQRGVANASAIASSALAKSKIDAFLAGKDLTQITEEEIRAFLHENGVIDVTNNMMYALQLAKMTVNGTMLNFDSDIESISKFVEKIGGSIVSLKMLGEAKKAQAEGLNSYAWSGMSDVANAAKQEVQSAINSAMDIKVDYKGYTPKKSSSSSSKTEKYTAEIDKFKDLSDAVEAVRDKIEKLNLEYDNTTDIQEQIKIKEQLITLYEDEKKALDALNKARDKEIAQNVSKLQKAGFEVLYDTTSDNLHIKNREHLNDLSQKTIKEYEELINKTDELNDANKESAKQWNELSYTVADNAKQISKLKSDQYEDYISDAEHLIDLLSNRDDSIGSDIPILQRMIDTTYTEWVRLTKEGYAVNKETIQKLEKDWISYYDKRLEAEKEVLEQQKETQDGVISAVTNLLDEQITGIDNQIKALQKLNDERKEALDLQKAQEALDKAREQKTKSVMRKGQGYVYEADQDAIKEAQENLSDIKFNSQVTALEKEKEALEDYKKLWSEIPNLYEKYQNELKAEQLLGANWEDKISDMRLSTYESFKDNYFDLQDEIFDKTEELNRHLNEEYIKMVNVFQQMAALMGQSPANSSSLESQMSDSDKATIKAAQSAYNTARAQGNKTAMDSAHALAESIRDKYRSENALATATAPNVATVDSTLTPAKTASNTALYTTKPYELVSTTKTGGSSNDSKSSLQSEYERQLKIAKTAGASKNYIDKLESAIAREKYGSGHTVDTYNNGLTNSTIINATNKAEANMSASAIQNKYETSVKNNTSSLDKVQSGLKGNTDAVEYAGDSMYNASDSIKTSTQTMAESNKETANSFTSAISSFIGSLGSSDSGSSSSKSSKSGSSGNSSSSGSALSAVSKLASAAVSAVKKVTKTLSSSKKKASGGINLRPDMYEVDEQGREIIISPSTSKGRLVNLSYGSSVIPADVSQRLWNIGSDPTAFFSDELAKLNKLDMGNINVGKSQPTKIEYNYTIQGGLELPNVTNGKTFAIELQNLPNMAKQWVKNPQNNR